ncbi:unnamed protein product [Angiostrongylus costaricensis]|uniref:Innexin n=1 Tax=Angiostrongylus costaricensis TaxID=334426 RepID=A0A158PDY7_ANGCS|nr:unnamed protein product [Angiostrongylus costaricensis]
MRIASATILEQDYHHGLRLREKGTNGICAGVCTAREGGPFKYPSKFMEYVENLIGARASFTSDEQIRYLGWALLLLWMLSITYMTREFWFPASFDSRRVDNPTPSTDAARMSTVEMYQHGSNNLPLYTVEFVKVPLKAHVKDAELNRLLKFIFYYDALQKLVAL